jgi:23S rRNA (adenine2503-C2)-methyltransferase
MEGKGRAQACWELLRLGVDPSWFFCSVIDDDGDYDAPETLTSTEDVGALKKQGWSRQEIQDSIPCIRNENWLGKKAIKILKNQFVSIEKDVASLSKISIAPDGTAKLLIKLEKDGLEIESVIIPWDDRSKSTLCISSQVGCKQACTFCATGRMGKLRNLSTGEILAQMHWANKVIRLQEMHPVDNIVFMGQGEPADNAEAVVKAADILIDHSAYQLAPRRVTISTVAPSPESFEELGKASVVLAWSVHASQDELRRELVPTTRHTMGQLRDGLISTLRGRRRSKRLRNVMLEITLLDQINDSIKDATHLVKFCQPLLEQVKGIKLVVNLIPWNDIDVSFGPASQYQTPNNERVQEYQKVLQSNGILCYIRTTRGDEENAACGMLTTRKSKEGTSSK